MKKRKVLSFLTAAVLTVGAVPFSVIHAAAADETYVQGDVDMDGYITGHDAAMVSRYLNVDPELLSDQQKALADMNGDGVVDQSDADAIFAQKVCGLGVTFQKGERKNPNVTDVYMVRYYSYTSNYRDYKVVADHSLEKDDIDDIIDQLESQRVISLRDFNLMDVDADGVVSEDDVEALICAVSRAGAQVKPIYPAEDRYDMNLVEYFDVEPGDLPQHRHIGVLHQCHHHRDDHGKKEGHQRQRDGHGKAGRQDAGQGLPQHADRAVGKKCFKHIFLPY